MTRPTRHILVLGACALAPITLGIAMHLEHAATVAACAAARTNDATPETIEHAPQVLAVPTPVVVVSPAVASSTPAPADPGAREFAFVVDIDGPHIVLATTIDEAWANGAPRYRGAVHDIYEVGEVWRKVDVERLPVEHRAAIGRSVDVYSSSGRVCTARIGAPTLVGELSGTIDYADEQAVRVAADGTKTVDARAAWKESRRLLVAPLLDSAECAEGVWARDAELSTPLVYAAEELELDERSASPAARVLQSLPAARKLASAFATHVTAMADDDTRPGPKVRLFDRMVARRWTEPTHGGALVVFTTDGAEFGMCGGFDFAWGAVRVDAAGLSGQAWLHEDTDSVRAIIDLEGDGRVEVIAETYIGPMRVLSFGLDAPDAEGTREIAMLPELPFHGCPC